MPRKTKTRSTPKTAEVLQIVDHIMETYKPQAGPVLLMWRETINGYRAKSSPNSEQWQRDMAAVHEHWLRFGKDVARELAGKRLTIVPVNRTIRRHLEHAHAPDRSGQRTDEFYRRCLPNSGPNGWVAGMVLFPREQSKDHPLIVFHFERRNQMMSSGCANVQNAAKRANSLDVLSEDELTKLRTRTANILRPALGDDHPLFWNLTAPDHEPAQ